MTTRDQITSNKVMTADFSAEPISNDFADEIAKALLVNTSVRQLSFNGTNLKDKGFEKIVDALIARKQNFPKDKYNPIVLNIDNTYLTVNCRYFE